MQEFVLIVSDKRKMALSYSTVLIRSFRVTIFINHLQSYSLQQGINRDISPETNYSEVDLYGGDYFFCVLETVFVFLWFLCLVTKMQALYSLGVTCHII